MAVKGKDSGNAVRKRRRSRIRKRVFGTDQKPRICVFRSSKHIYAQLITDESRKTLVSASTAEEGVRGKVDALTEAELKGQSRSCKGVAAALQVGLELGRRAKEKGFSAVVFDRNGFMYHGRVKSVADGARKAGLEF